MIRQPCETILYNGRIVTVDRDFSIAESIALANGKFLKVGTNRDIRALADQYTKEIDLKGKTVVPGFIDTHPHMIHEAIIQASTVPITGLTSIDDIKNCIAEQTRKCAPGKWIVTAPIGEPPYFFNVPGILKEKRWPTRWDLDEISPDHPVYISPPSSKAPNTAIMNSYALKLIGITQETADEQGIHIVRDQATGEPNGQLNGMQPIYNSSQLIKKLKQLLPAIAREDIVTELKRVIKERNAAGVTTVYEPHDVFPEHLLFCKELWSRNELTMRICFAYELRADKSLTELENYIKNLAHATGTGFGDDLLKICGITVSIDGPIRLGLGLMREPYLDPYGKQTTGLQLIPTEIFKNIALFAARNNLRLNSCVGGDKAADLTLEVFKETHKQIPIADKHWIVQHIRFSSQKNIDMCKELALHVTICTNFEWGEGSEIYVGRLGKDLAGTAMPLRKWLDAGVCIAQSTDFGPYQPMFTIWQSLKRTHGLSGESYAGKDQQITREEAIRIYTINGARVLFWEDKLGSIEAGKLADLVVLDNDILTCPLDEIRDTRVAMTMVGGKVVYEKEGD